MSSEKGWCGASRDDRWKLLLRWQIQLGDQHSGRSLHAWMGQRQRQTLQGQEGAHLC